MDANQLRLSRHDDQIYSRFREVFPDLKVDVLDENQIKSNEGKTVIWHEPMTANSLFVALEVILRRIPRTNR